ncbi:MAG: hypothetical protein ACLFUJ_12185 [Phycisphaerae bacterium]
MTGGILSVVAAGMMWAALGIFFSRMAAEALLACSLEFLPTQPRLREQVVLWLSENRNSVLTSRLRKFTQAQADPRGLIWQAIEGQGQGQPKQPQTPCYGLDSLEELKSFCQELADPTGGNGQSRHRLGKPEKTNATVVLRARDLLGTDARHFILVYLLANHGSGKLKNVAAWSGQSYRNISKVSQRWELAGILTVDHGFARLSNSSTWETLLALDPPEIVLLNWQRFYNACIKLLRSLQKARSKSISADGPVVAGLAREAAKRVAASLESPDPSASETIEHGKVLLSEFT